MNRVKFFLPIMILAISVSNVWSQCENVLPAPKHVKMLGTKMVEMPKQSRRIVATVGEVEGLPAEGYRLVVEKNRITVQAVDSAAWVWAAQTLIQLFDSSLRLPQVEIIDYPTFKWRGFMHDTGRNFIEIDMLKRHLDLLSRYKINVFQWHLTDNPAWRIECRVYPQLNDAKYQRKGRDEGKFYTYDQIREVIAYARKRGIMVVPEIDMPGHSAFFNNTFGFSMDSQQGREVLEKCLDEFFNEIPISLAPYFHIGSDEVHISDPVGFMAWSEEIAAKYNRKALAWDPGLPTSDSTIRQIWNEADGANSAAAKKTGPYVDSFMGYLNYYDPIVFTNRNFLHQPCGVKKPSEASLGGILCLWNDVNVDDKSRIELHNGMLNGLLPFAERFWNGALLDNGDVKNLNVLPDPKSKTGQELLAFEKKMAYHRDNLLRGHDMRWVANAAIEWKIKIADTTIKAWGGAIDMSEICTLYKLKSQPTMDATATTYIYSNKDTTIRAWVGFDAPARSNRIGVGIGKQGEWEGDGKVTVNGEQVNPPKQWNEPEKYAIPFNTWHKPEEELPYTDEQFYWMREPAYINLKKGQNEIVLSVPKTFAGQRWSFAFIPLTLNDDGSVSELKLN